MLSCSMVAFTNRMNSVGSVNCVYCPQNLLI